MEKKGKIFSLENKGKWGMLAAITLILVVVPIAVSIYNSPTNRYTRQLDLGNKYLAELNYEEAVVAFEKAIAIDERSFAAYLGGIEAYIGLGDQEKLTDFYERALAAIGEADQAEVTGNLADIVAIYLKAEAVYGQDLEKIVAVLGEGCEKTEDVVVKEQMTGFLQAYLDALMGNREYGKVRDLIEKYKDMVDGIDFDAILAAIASAEKLDAIAIPFLQKVYAAMTAEDHSALSVLYKSEEMHQIMALVQTDRYVYYPEGEGGIGVGVHVLPDGFYAYFYCGEYVDGKRNGQGMSYAAAGLYDEYDEYGEDYGVAQLTWVDDKPNGPGTHIYYRMEEGVNVRRTINTGHLKDGLWHGTLEETLEYADGLVENYVFQVTDGVIEDLTQEYYDAGGTIQIDEDMYIIHYEIHEDGTSGIMCNQKGRIHSVLEFGSDGTFWI